MSASHNVTAAKAEAEAHKRQLVSTLHEIQYRLKPSTIAQDAWAGVRDTATVRGDQAAGMVREKPQAAGAIAAALVLLVARKPLLGLLGRAFGSRDDDHLNTDLAKADAHVGLRAPVVSKQNGVVPEQQNGVVPEQQGVIA